MHFEETSAQLLDLAKTLGDEQQRVARQGLSEQELALFDLLYKDNVTKAQRETEKQASKDLLDKLRGQLAAMEQWTEKEQTQAQVRILILDEFRLPNTLLISRNHTQRIALKAGSLLFRLARETNAVTFAHLTIL